MVLPAVQNAVAVKLGDNVGVGAIGSIGDVNLIALLGVAGTGGSGANLDGTGQISNLVGIILRQSDNNRPDTAINTLSSYIRTVIRYIVVYKLYIDLGIALVPVSVGTYGLVIIEAIVVLVPLNFIGATYIEGVVGAISFLPNGQRNSDLIATLKLYMSANSLLWSVFQDRFRRP